MYITDIIQYTNSASESSLCFIPDQFLSTEFLGAARETGCAASPATSPAKNMVYKHVHVWWNLGMSQLPWNQGVFFEQEFSCLAFEDSPAAAPFPPSPTTRSNT